MTEQAEGVYVPDDSGQLVWRKAAEDANARIEVAVADGADGRFVPGLNVTVTVLDGGQELFGATEPFPIASPRPFLIMWCGRACDEAGRGQRR